MHGFLPIFFLLVVLKIPVLGALWLIWWASKAPENESSQDDSNGGSTTAGHLPTRPRGPHTTAHPVLSPQPRPLATRLRSLRISRIYGWKSTSTVWRFELTKRLCSHFS